MKAFKYFVICTILVASINSEAQNMKQFYYSVASLSQPVTYRIVDDISEQTAYYLYMYRMIANVDTFLVSETYDTSFVKLDYVKEKITASGTEITKYVKYVNGKTIDGNILENQAILWNMNVSTHASFKVITNFDSGEKELWKLRTRYSSNTVLKDYDQKTYECVTLTDYFIIHSAEKDEVTVFYQSSTWYEGLGMMEVKRFTAKNDLVFSQHITEIIDHETWQKKLDAK